MIQVLLRIAVWVAVFGIGYLVFGPQLFDSSPDTNPFASDSQIYLPAARSARQIALEEAMKNKGLTPEEVREYQSLVQARNSEFWQREGVSVEDALSGIKTRRKAHLAEILQQRGLTDEESSIFLMVVARDHPAVLADRD